MRNKKDYLQIEDQYAPHFLTFTTVGWVDVFTRKECRDIVIESMRYCQANKGLLIYAYVVMSNHLHLIWAAKEATDGLSALIRDFKRHTAKQIIKWIKEDKESRKDWMDIVFKYHGKYNSNNELYQVWQQKSSPKILLHPRFSMQKLFYIHQNPVEAGIVLEQEHYWYSSARNYMGLEPCLLEVELMDFGVQEGYVFT